MFSWQQFMVSALVGAAIGYITNWIAIKMLFRPVHAKRVLGIRLPFTPGVIPKEKDRLARSIGDTVSRHLLTGEYISGQLLSPVAEDRVRHLVRHNVSRVNGKTVGECLEQMGLDLSTRDKWLEQTNGIILKGIRDRRVIDFISGQLAAGIVQLLDRRPEEILNTPEYKACRDHLERAILSFLCQRENRIQFQQFLAGRVDLLCESTSTVKDCLPEGLLIELRAWVGEQAPRVVSLVDSYLNAPDTRKLLAKRVEGFFGQGFLHRIMGNVLGRLGNDSGQLADKIVDEVAGFFSEPENRNILAQKLESMFNELLDQRICDLAAKVDESSRNKALVELSRWLSDKLCSGELLSVLLARTEKTLANSNLDWGELLGVQDRQQAEQNIKNYLTEAIIKATGRPDFETFLTGLIQKLSFRVMNSGINELWPDLTPDKTAPLEEKVLSHYRSFVGLYLPDILSFVDISQLISRRVDDLNVLQVEELVLGIMRRELIAITWLGALLGAGIGISMVFLQQFL